MIITQQEVGSYRTVTVSSLSVSPVSVSPPTTITLLSEKMVTRHQCREMAIHVADNLPGIGPCVV